MDFGDILSEWDKETAKPYGKKRLKEDEKHGISVISTETLAKAHPVDVWLRRYGIQDKDNTAGEECETITPAERRQLKHAMKPEAVIDLHGCTRDEAWSRLEAFFADSQCRGLQKILIIHGKGTHSDNGSVLQQVVKHFIEQNRHAGESGLSKKEDGGSGSTWVLLK